MPIAVTISNNTNLSDAEIDRMVRLAVAGLNMGSFTAKEDGEEYSLSVTLPEYSGGRPALRAMHFGYYLQSLHLAAMDREPIQPVVTARKRTAGCSPEVGRVRDPPRPRKAAGRAANLKGGRNI